MKVSKQNLIQWANALQAEVIDIDTEFLGGGNANQDGSRQVIAYELHLCIAEEFASNQDAALGLLKETPRPYDSSTFTAEIPYEDFLRIEEGKVI